MEDCIIYGTSVPYTSKSRTEKLKVYSNHQGMSIQRYGAGGRALSF